MTSYEYKILEVHHISRNILFRDLMMLYLLNMENLQSRFEFHKESLGEVIYRDLNLLALKNVIYDSKNQCVNVFFVSIEKIIATKLYIFLCV